MKRWFLALFSVLLCITAAVLPLMGSLFEPPPAGIDLSALQLPMYVKPDVDGAGVGVGFVPGELLVKFRKGVLEGEVAGLRSGLGAQQVGFGVLSQVRRWRVPGSRTVEEWAELLRRNPLVEVAEPNYYYHSSLVPNDPVYAYQWHLDNPVYGGIGMEEAWNLGRGAAGVVVAVVDTGVAYEDYSAPSFWHISTYKAYSGSS